MVSDIFAQTPAVLTAGSTIIAQKRPLSPCERGFVALILLTVLLIITISGKTRWQSSVDDHKKLLVRVVGEVEQEKTIEVPLGATVADVLALVCPTNEAALQKLALDATVRRGDVIVVPKRGCLSIFVKGKINELFFFPEGSQFADLQGKLAIQGKRKKRKLKDGEVIDITS